MGLIDPSQHAEGQKRQLYKLFNLGKYYRMKKKRRR
jgi:hypothetical protein